MHKVVYRVGLTFDAVPLSLEIAGNQLKAESVVSQ